MCCVNLLGGLALSILTLTLWWHWDWVVSSSGESGSTILRNLGLVYGGLIAIWVALWRGVVADRQAEASRVQGESSMQLAKAAEVQADTSQRGLLNERYQRSAEMLGSKVMAVRLGGIFALHRLGKHDPEQYHVQTMRLLSSFVCYPTEEARSTDREDVRVALAVIGTRNKADIALERKEAYRVFLISADLSNMILRGPNLTGAKLIGANLTNTFLGTANLTGVHLFDANLTRTDLSRTRGLTQFQLDEACADPAGPPKLGSLCDARTGEPLVWNDNPCS